MMEAMEDDVGIQVAKDKVKKGKKCRHRALSRPLA
ncbi:UNVERIFIED_ORG: hypothetical protein ABRZ91_000143 [Heyndrickxia coagulans]